MHIYVSKDAILYASISYEKVMRTTLNIDDELLAEAQRVTGLEEKTALVKAGLIALIERESARRLAQLGGTEKALKAIPRRRASG